MASAALIAALWLPLMWSAVLAVGSGPLPAGTETDERRRLGLMILPAGLGVLFVIMAPHAPASALPPMVEPWWTAATAAVARVPAGSMARSQSPVDAGVILAVLWAVGALFGACRLYRTSRRLQAIVHAAVPDAVEPRVRWTSTAITPLVGPGDTIVLPEILRSRLSERQRALVIAHERTHITRRDPAYFRRLAVLDVVFWFNPFVQRQTERCRLAAELAVDATVVRHAPSSRRDYASSLVEVLRWTACPAAHTSPAIFAFAHQGAHEMRITEILHPQRRRRTRRIALIVIGALCAPLAFLQWSYAEQSKTTLPFSVHPLDGEITARFGNGFDPFAKRKRFHRGLDIKAATGTPIVAPGPGRVVETSHNPKTYGYLLVIDHGQGVVTRYGHLAGFEVKKGDRVKAGTIVGRVGSTGRSTGPHLHFEVLKDGKFIDPESVTPALQQTGALHRSGKTAVL